MGEVINGVMAIKVGEGVNPPVKRKATPVELLPKAIVLQGRRIIIAYIAAYKALDNNLSIEYGNSTVTNIKYKTPEEAKEIVDMLDNIFGVTNG